MDVVSERILIKNFFSIKKIDWKIKNFNVLTGGMAAGKSLCIKLVYFFENILYKNIFFSSISRETLKKEIFYGNLSKQFYYLFPSENTEKDFFNTEIIYTFTVNDNKMVFDLAAKWKESSKKLEWTSNYIDSHIDIWRGFFDEKGANDRNINNRIYAAIDGEFMRKFPIAAWFIPASRQIASVLKEEKNIDEKIYIMDAFLLDFLKNTMNLVSRLYNTYDNSDYKLKIKKLLKINNMLLFYDKQSNEYKISIESTAGSKITPLELSAGQQQLLYLLLIITSDITTTSFYNKEEEKPIIIFNDNISVFIEEPSSNLFPKEQKDTIEFITEIFRTLKDDKNKNARFFITTHSPYILNVINNMLKKGSILKDNKEQTKKINKKIKFPHLYKTEFSAIFINKNGKHRNMLGKNEEVMYADEIMKISFSINDDTNNLDDLNDLLIHEGN